MKFDDVKLIFYQHIHRRYHRHCRELFAQLICLHLNIKPAYLFDLFSFSIQEMRNLLASLSSYLSFRSIILKYSLNDLVIMNSSQLTKLIDPSTSVLIIDLDTMLTTDHHPVLDKVRSHLSWINTRQHEQLDFDNETNEEWSNLIQSLNHTTVFGYVLGYPLIYFYLSTPEMNITTLRNFRLYVKINDHTDEILLYSFSCPIHTNINDKQIDSIVSNFFSSLSAIMNQNQKIKNYRLDTQIKEQSSWCL
ncbi:unnamed protein product [Rotaria socialis]|uniref:Uncharacterized protein n=1 Tax=Rotaria socialis TaxID=392032 RepID=A0A820HXP6_9BILA|nr:unnamed protein product [Rotaria socialis]CAF4303172.1 unnamed protein product [Rotaria socialis]